jgi:hypothetical protein
MARPKKATVNYFPHVTEQGKTLYILQSKWGNDGYAVWFKLLERLGATDNHYIDYGENGTRCFLAAYCRVSEEVLDDILQTLASMNAIDPSFYQRKLIFSQHFVENVAFAYSKRVDSLPTRDRLIELLNLFKEEET